jgi:hypothetical protein
MRRVGVVLPAVLLLGAVAGCAVDVAMEVKRNAQARERVLTALASDGKLAEQATQRLLAADSLRARVVDVVLQDSPSAAYVLARIGRNPAAMDYVLQAAWSDSISRAHLVARMETIRRAVSAR